MRNAIAMGGFMALALSLVCAVEAAAPVPKAGDKPARNYYPTAAGTKWVYEDGGVERTWEISAAEKKGEETIVTVVESGTTGPVAVEKVAVSKKGLFKLETGRFTHAHPVCLLKLPAKAGDTWDFDVAQQDLGQQPGLRGERGTVTVGKVEEVKVPAGTFKALRVEVVLKEVNGQELGTPVAYTRWYDPEIGLVKMTQGEWTRELKSYTLGKK